MCLQPQGPRERKAGGSQASGEGLGARKAAGAAEKQRHQYYQQPHQCLSEICSQWLKMWWLERMLERMLTHWLGC
jgi:hypothetical protein